MAETAIAQNLKNGFKWRKSKPEVIPFSRDYVIFVTAHHMLKKVDISISRTLSRIPEFEGNAEKSSEIIKTLSELHKMRRNLEELKGSCAVHDFPRTK